MSDSDIPILVVDDAKFSSAIIAKVLRTGGFSNVRFTNNPLEALRSLEKRPAQVVIADWLMPAMDGLELTRKIKKLDESQDHFTYVLLMTTRDDFDALKLAFEVGVDDFINKTHLRSQLLPRVVAADRIATRDNDLIKNNRLLQRKVKDLQTTDLIDAVTGLGNQRFTMDRASELLAQSQSRGGAACLLLIGVNNLDVIKNQYDQGSVDEMMSAIAAKIRQLVRPLDLVTRPEGNVFSVLMLQSSINNCTSQSFKRIFDSLYMHSFKTSQGYIPVVVGVSISAADKSTGYPDAKTFMSFAYEGLAKSFDTGLITVRPFDISFKNNGYKSTDIDD